jgi:hypothetical protein
MIEKVLGVLPVKFVDNERFEKTVKALKEKGFISQDGLFVDGGKSWGIIGPDTPIDGRVYPAVVGGSVLVSYGSSQRLQNLYGLILKNLSNQGLSGGGINSRKMAVLEEVFYIGKEVFYRAGDQKFIKFCKEHRIPYYHVVSLDEFLKHGVGTCRHMALFAACMVERLIKDGYLEGARVSVDKNEINGEAHAWCRVTFNDSTDPNQTNVWILDAAGDYLGPLNKGNKAKDGIKWDYRRPEDKRLRSGGIRENFGGLLRNVLRR